MPVRFGSVTDTLSINDVAEIALSPPEVSAGTRDGNHTWLVARNAFAWERPFSKSDLKRFGDTAVPDGPILAVATEDPGEKEALLKANPAVYFTIAHFDGHAAVLLRLNGITKKKLRAVLVDAGCGLHLISCF